MADAGEHVDHVIALVLENRSFDHVLGDLGRSGAMPIDGGSADMTNPDINGNAVPLSAVEGTIERDLPHDFASVLLSTMDGHGGFVLADQVEHGSGPDDAPSFVMSYFRTGDLPVTHALAREYAVSDEWYCSVPAGTWPNRLFLVAASSGGRVTQTIPPLLFDIPTVFDRLGRDRWAVYNDQLPAVALIRSLAVEWARSRVGGGSFRRMAQFEEDCAAGRLRAFSLIEPSYLGDDANDGHPPHDVMRAEELIARVFLALRRSPAWSRSLLVILYDEHGGLFDHRPAPRPVPGTGIGELGFEFERLGVRVPCLIVSPLVPRGSVWRPPSDGFADHTSLVATVLRRHGLEPLTARDAAAADVWDALSLNAPREDDGPVVAELERWMGERAAAAGRLRGAPPGDGAVPGATGREAAATIVATGGLGAIAAPGEGVRAGPVPGAPAGGRDVSLDQAIVDLANAILELPA